MPCAGSCLASLPAQALSLSPKSCSERGVLRGCHFLDTRHVLGGFRAEWSPRSDEPQLALQGTVAEREKTPEGQLFSVVAGCVLLVKAQVSVVWGLGQH